MAKTKKKKNTKESKKSTATKKKASKKKKKELSAKQLEGLKKGREKRHREMKTKKIEEIFAQKDPLSSLTNVKRPYSHIFSPETKDLNIEEAEENKENKMHDFMSQRTPLQTDEFGNEINEEQIPVNYEKDDIWNAAYNKLTAIGDVPKFTIYKNSELLATKMWPCDWMQLKQQYGGGHYKVQARSSNSGQIVQTQSQSISETVSEKRDRLAEEGLGVQAPVSNESNTETVERMMNMFQNLGDRIKADVKADNQNQNQGNGNFMAILMQTMQAQSENSSKTSLQMMQFQIESNNKLTENQNKMFEKMTEMQNKQSDKLAEAIKQMGENNKGKESEFSMYLRMQEITTNQQEKMNDIIEKKAILLSEQLAANTNESDSAVDTMIKNLVPMIAQGMAAGRANMINRQIPLQTEPQNIERKEFDVKRKNIQQEELNTLKNQNSQMRKFIRQQQPGKVQKPVTTNPVTPIKTAPTIVAPDNGSQNKPSAVISNIDEANAKQVIESIIPVLLQDMGSGLAPSESAQKIMQFLAQNKVSIKYLLDNFKIDDIVKSVTELGMSAQEIGWIKEFYANIENTFRTTTKQPSTDRPVQTL